MGDAPDDRMGIYFTVILGVVGVVAACVAGGLLWLIVHVLRGWL